MRGFKAAATTAALLGLAITGGPAAASAADYDGEWTVMVVTDHGACAHTSSYEVRVAHGSILYTSYTSLSLQGSVSPQGAVSVLITHFDDNAMGSGRLYSQRAGSGGWQGTGKDGACSGRWEARRR